jgi:hypothetical protein
MDQRGAVEKLDDRCEADSAAIFAACVAGGKKQKRWPQPFPSAAQQISGNFRYGRERRVTLPHEFLFDQNEVVADEIKYLFDRQQRDGVSPA